MFSSMLLCPPLKQYNLNLIFRIVENFTGYGKTLAFVKKNQGTKIKLVDQYCDPSEYRANIGIYI